MPALRRSALAGGGGVRRFARRLGARLRQLGAARPQGQSRDVRVAGRGRSRRERSTRRASRQPCARWSHDPRSGRRVVTHRRPEVTAEALASLLIATARAGRDALLRRRGDRQARRSRGLVGADRRAGSALDVDICFALGGDGTILTALRAYAGTGVPVFGVNYGEMGFLATVDRENAEEGWRRALAGDFEMLSLPAIELSRFPRPPLAGDQRRLDQPPAGQPRRRSRLFGRRRRGRPRPLRRARRRHAGRLDRLQPRQRRSGDGLGGGGVRRLVHRPALADRAAAGGRARPIRSRSTTAAARRRSTSPSTAGRCACCRPARACEARFTRQPGHAGADPRHLVLQPAATEVRPARLAPVDARRVGATAPVAAGPGGRPRGRMLHELRVENLLLMERAELRLGPGLNVLTGETGAGKTLLAHALDLLLGGRARRGIVRPGAAEAYVEGVFELPAAAARLRAESRTTPRSSCWRGGCGRTGARARTSAAAPPRQADLQELGGADAVVLRPARASQADAVRLAAGPARCLLRRRRAPAAWPTCGSPTARVRELAARGRVAARAGGRPRP